jgi:spermidine synthase
MYIADNRDRASIEIPIEGTPYRIVDQNGYRSLMVKGNDMSVHSEMLLSAPDVLVLSYTRVMLHALPFSRRLDDILMIGLGGGNLTKFLYRYLPATRLATVEIDAQIVDIARTYFRLPPDSERLSVLVGDGRHYIETHPHCCDVLLCDGYDQTFNVPDSLTGEDFYRACYRALRPGGVIAINLDRRSDAWRVAHLRMLGKIFSSHMEIPVMDCQSVLLLFRDAPTESYAVRMQRARDMEASMELDLPASVHRYEIMRQSRLLGEDQ